MSREPCTGLRKGPGKREGGAWGQGCCLPRLAWVLFNSSDSTVPPGVVSCPLPARVPCSSPLPLTWSLVFGASSLGGQAAEGVLEFAWMSRWLDLPVSLWAAGVLTAQSAVVLRQLRGHQCLAEPCLP